MKKLKSNRLSHLARGEEFPTPAQKKIYAAAETVPAKVARRLEYLRAELRAERISHGELSELQSLAPYIAPDDVELLEAAGVPEHTQERAAQHTPEKGGGLWQ